MSWKWLGPWAKLRQDVNLVAWLLEEFREIQRLQYETLLWALGVDCHVGEVEAGAAPEGATDDPERSA